MTDSELEARLRSVELNLASLSQLLSDNLRHLCDLGAKHDLVLYGNPLDPKEESLGLVTKVDRLMQAEGIRRWVLRTAGGTVFMLLGAALAKFLAI